jgi:hypothetical protein
MTTADERAAAFLRAATYLRIVLDPVRRGPLALPRRANFAPPASGCRAEKLGDISIYGQESNYATFISSPSGGQAPDQQRASLYRPNGSART